jgi:hypothetical protein
VPGPVLLFSRVGPVPFACLGARVCCGPFVLAFVAGSFVAGSCSNLAPVSCSSLARRCAYKVGG